MPTPSPLEYAPRAPMHRRRVFRRFLILILGSGFVTSGWWWGPPLWWKAQLLYWQHQCLSHVQVPGQLIYQSRPSITIVPKEWQEFYFRYSPPGMNSTGTIFLGRMTSPAGHSRFVAIDSLQDSDFFGPNISAQARVFRDDGIMLQLVTTPQKSPVSLGTLTESGVDPLLKVYTGTLDPTNPSHVVFDTNEDDLHYAYNVWLGDDDIIVIGKGK